MTFYIGYILIREFKKFQQIKYLSVLCNFFCKLSFLLVHSILSKSNSNLLNSKSLTIEHNYPGITTIGRGEGRIIVVSLRMIKNAKFSNK